MRKELAKKQSKLKHYILTPIRIVKKAKELYVKGVVDCAGALGVGVASSVHPRLNGQIRRELISGTVPVVNQTTTTQKGETNETRAVVMQQHKPTLSVSVGYKYKYNRMKMSYHTEPEVRKMGTIDEDKPCYFEEDLNAFHSKPNANLLYLYPRSTRAV